MPRSPIDFLWFLPSAGDQRFLASTIGARAASPAYLRQVALAADQLGFSGALTPTPGSPPPRSRRSRSTCACSSRSAPA